MGYKEDLISALSNEGLPTGLLSKTVPTIPDLRSFSDAETAVMAIADFFVNYNEILKLFSGEKYFDIMLRSGQLNPSLQAGVLASIEGV